MKPDTMGILVPSFFSSAVNALVPCSKYGTPGRYAPNTTRSRSGSAALSAGADTLRDGLTTLYDGILSLRDGVPALRSGVSQLRDGAKQLDEGLGTFNTDGISKLTKILRDDVGSASERLKAIINVSRDYNSFSGITDETDGNVKFIYRTDSIGD